MATMKEVRDTITRLGQQAHDLYWDRDEDGQLRNLHPCELRFLDQHRDIHRRFDAYLAAAEDVHGHGPLYQMISECANRQRAIELQIAWQAMATLREEVGA